MAKILLIEDDKKLALTIKEELETSGYSVEACFDGETGEYKAITNDFDLIIVDLILPDKSGVKICQSLRREKVNSSILVLTGEIDVNKKVLALDKGADDYLTKPFSFAELKARIRALLRRKADSFTSLSAGNLSLDVDKKVVKRAGKIIPLRRKEIALLEYLMRNQGRVVTRDMILNHIWGDEDEPSYNTVDVHVKYLRDKIDKNFPHKLIKTIYGLGYKIETEKGGEEK